MKRIVSYFDPNSPDPVTQDASDYLSVYIDTYVIPNNESMTFYKKDGSEDRDFSGFEYDPYVSDMGQDMDSRYIEGELEFLYEDILDWMENAEVDVFNDGRLYHIEGRAEIPYTIDDAVLDEYESGVSEDGEPFYVFDASSGQIEFGSPELYDMEIEVVGD